MKVIFLRVEDELQEKLEALAIQDDRSVNKYITRVLEAHVGSLVIPTPQKNTPVATQHSEASIVDPEEIRSINIPPLPEGKIVMGTTPPGPNEFKEALDAAEQKCCRLKSPCKHWQFDGEDWVNTLSGRKREVEQ